MQTQDQTEDQDPISSKGLQLCSMIIQDLGENDRNLSIKKDDVYEALCICVCELLEKHQILFNGMVHRVDVTDYQVFDTIANELFEANSETGRLRITWGRIVSLFAFAVRLVQHNNQDKDRVEEVTRYLSQYLSKHVIKFVRDNGGWDGLVEQFPPPVDSDAQFKKALLWSGLCVGAVATIVFIIRMGKFTKRLLR